MPSNEDIYQQMLREEEEDAERRREQLRAPVEARAKPRALANEAEARERYNRDIKPVLDRRARVAQGLPPTKNPLVNLYLKATGQIAALSEGIEVVAPTDGIAIQDGKTEEEMRQQMIANPELFKGMGVRAPEVRPVSAQRKTVEDLRGGRE